jgi:hypothetical protein
MYVLLVAMNNSIVPARQRGGGSLRKRVHNTTEPAAADNDDVVESVPPVMLQGPLLFFQNEPLLQQCRQELETRIFPPGWHVGWAVDPDSVPLVFASRMMRELLQRHFMETLDRLWANRCAAFWYVRDVAGWLRALAGATLPEDVKNVGLPFGVLRAEETALDVRLAAPTAALQTHTTVGAHVEEAREADVRRRYKFGLFEGGAGGLTLVPLAPQELADMQEYVAVTTGRPLEQLASAMEPWRQNLRKPASPIYSLMERRREVREANDNLGDAAFQVSHPLMLLRAKLPSVAQITPEVMGDQALYAAPDLLAAAMSRAREEQRYSLQQAWRAIKRAQAQTEAVTGFQQRQRSGALTRRQRHKLHYQRPDAWDDVIPLEENLEVAHAPPPTVLDDVRTLEQLYRGELLAFMGVPEAMLTRGGTRDGGKGTLTGEKQQEMNRMADMDETVKNARLLLQRYFAYLMLTTFGSYQLQQVDAVEARLITRAAPATVAAVRAQLNKTRARAGLLHDAEMVLVFPEQGTVGQQTLLANQLKLYDRGLVEVSELEKYARAALSPDVRLREPPPPPDAAVQPGDAAKKRKAGGSGGGEPPKKKLKPLFPKPGPGAVFLEKNPRAAVLDEDL